jgi:hypothetical protein
MEGKLHSWEGRREGRRGRRRAEWKLGEKEVRELAGKKDRSDDEDGEEEEILPIFLHGVHRTSRILFSCMARLTLETKITT